MSRRGAVKALGGLAGVAFAAGDLFAQQRAEPPSTITNPPRDFDQPTTYFTDPDILTVDPSFNAYVQPQNSIRRLWTGGLWLEGPAWSGVGKYLVFSDIPNNRQMRWSEDEGRVSVFRYPANNSNGNTFDFQGRQLSCEHLMRRVVRYEHDGSVTIIADNYGGKRLNSPNDVVPHPDGSYWFTDPPYGGGLFEGQPDAAGGPTNASGRLNPRLGLPPELGTFRRELPTGEPGRAATVPLDGELPSPADPPSGCVFRTRCPMADELCARETPHLRRVGEGSYAACHFVQDPASGELPAPLREGTVSKRRPKGPQPSP